MEIARSPSSKDSPGVEESSVQWPKTAIQHVKYFFPGKILLSELTDEKIDFLLEKMDLVAVTNRTITDKDRLFFEIRKARKMGYATSFGERARGSSCISVPVRNYSVSVALSVLGPYNRFTMDRIRESLGEVKASAKRISASLAGIR